MASNSKITKFKRKRKRTSMGKARKRIWRRQTTPPFPIHPEDADSKAAEAEQP